MEREAKFIVPDEATFARLKRKKAFGPYSRARGQVKQIHDRYFDTTKRRFYKRNLYVRLREGDREGTLLITLKQLDSEAQGAIHERSEYQAEVQSINTENWPEGEARSLAEEIARGKPLIELFALDQTRDVSILQEGDRPVAELSLDVVKIDASGSPPPAYELEIELLATGTVDDLHALATTLAEQYHLMPQTLSKFERAMSLTTAGDEPIVTDLDAPAEHGEQTTSSAEGESHSGKKGEPGVLPTDSMPEASRKVLRVGYEAMLDNEKGARNGDIEALHDMRVATRRMRAALRVTKPYLSKSPQNVQKGLKEVTHALGAVRDKDVLITNAEEFRESLPPEQRQNLDALIAGWRAGRDKARKKMVQMLESKEYRLFEKRMSAFLEESDSPSKQATTTQPRQVRHVAGSAIFDRYENVRAFETVIASATLEQLHLLRIAGKYLRYSLELFREVLPADAEGLIEDVTQMQDQLGALHDAHVAAELLRRYISKGHDRKEEQAGTGLPDGLTTYLAEREGTARAIVSDFGPTWEKLISPEWRARLAATIAAV